MSDAATVFVDFPHSICKNGSIAFKRAGIKKEDIAIREFNEAFVAIIQLNEQVSKVTPFDSDL